MAIWLIRAGSHGEYEQKFIQEYCASLTPTLVSGNSDVCGWQDDQETA